jgi:hypothetical protein
MIPLLRGIVKRGFVFAKEGFKNVNVYERRTSFVPSSNWDVIYFLDARDWLNDNFILYRIPLQRTTSEWRNIQVSKSQTFEDQTIQGRPRITWNSLYPQIYDHVRIVYKGILKIYLLNKSYN